jgi:hypothetical protein
MTPRQLANLHALKSDFAFYAPRALKVLSKEGKVVPLALNTTQLHIHAKLEAQLRSTGKVRALILKGRQQGASTFIAARFYWKLQFRKGKRALIITHEQSATDNLFAMTKRYHDHLPEAIRPVTALANSRELYFDKLDSGYKVATAGTKEVGRSNTAQYFHGSEAAFWPHAASHFAGIAQAVPNTAETEIILESTANGVDNEFHQRWKRAEAGQGEYIAIFCPWFWQREYRTVLPKDFELRNEEVELAESYGLDKEQLYWRRLKIDDDFGGDVTLFQQEYPNNAAEAFVAQHKDSLIPATHIMAARRTNAVSLSGPLVVGVDPARFGDDKTAIVWRRGRVITKVRTYEKKSTMQVAGIVAQIIENDSPARVFIDTVGLGAGVYDRLVELNYGETVASVQASESAEDDDKYRNKRAECWVRMRDWFHEKPVQVPDSDEIMADLMEPGYSYDSKGRYLIESKADIKKRGARSPDIADAISLTFAQFLRKPKQMKIDPNENWGVLDDEIGY